MWYSNVTIEAGNNRLPYTKLIFQQEFIFKGVFCLRTLLSLISILWLLHLPLFLLMIMFLLRFLSLLKKNTAVLLFWWYSLTLSLAFFPPLTATIQLPKFVYFRFSLFSHLSMEWSVFEGQSFCPLIIDQLHLIFLFHCLSNCSAYNFLFLL